MNVTYETLFAEKVAAEIEETYRRHLEEEGTNLRAQFVLVPSLDDPVADCVYPQPPLGDRIAAAANGGGGGGGGYELRLPGAEGISYGTLGLEHVETAGREDEGGGTSLSSSTATAGRKRVHCVSNPCTLRIDDLVLGLTSTDILHHLSADTADANLEPGTRLSRIAQHLLQQRSYYPLFPPPAAPPLSSSRSNSSRISPPNLELKMMDYWSIPVTPDVLILPSKLAPMARPVLGNRTLALNPGTVVRGTNTGGTYAVLDVRPAPSRAREGDDEAPAVDLDESRSALQDRIRVDVKRI